MMNNNTFNNANRRDSLSRDRFNNTNRDSSDKFNVKTYRDTLPPNERYNNKNYRDTLNPNERFNTDKSTVNPNDRFNNNTVRDTIPTDKTLNDRYNNRSERDTMPHERSDNNDRFRPDRNPMPQDKLKNSAAQDTMLNGRYGRNNDKMPNDKMRGDKMNKGMEGDKMAAHPMHNTKQKHVMMKEGKVIIMKMGKMTTVKNYTNLRNGTKVMSDGSIVKKDGTTTMLQDGEMVNMMGEVMPNHN